MSSNKVQWEEPPEAGGGRVSKYQWYYDGLKEKPGEWAKYPGSAGGAMGYAKRHNDYEVTTRVVDTDDGTEQQAWMMYDPKDDDEDIDVGQEFEASDA